MNSTGGLSTMLNQTSVRRSSSTTTTYKIEYDEHGKPRVKFSASGVLPNGTKFEFFGGSAQRSFMNVKPTRPKDSLPSMTKAKSSPKLPPIGGQMSPFEREVKLEEISIIKEFTKASKETLSETKKVVKALMLRWHPDKHPNKNLATRIFQFIASRKRVLLEEADSFD
eukprot:GDKK01074073.1.p1 GENE.GDKK01074073.1~~GDKK01074073.1.p1  ORF type:complete len:168 (-),score=25.23 GDKK01074073.1:247-750(-)